MSLEERVSRLEKKIDGLVEAINQEAKEQQAQANHFKSFWSHSAEDAALTVSAALYRIRIRYFGQKPVSEILEQPTIEGVKH